MRILRTSCCAKAPANKSFFHLGNFSPYVLLFTDYSAGRKTPLEQEIFIFEKQKSAEEKFEALVTENVKKGWEKS